MKIESVIKIILVSIVTAGALGIISIIWATCPINFNEYSIKIKGMFVFVRIILTLVVGIVWFALFESIIKINKKPHK